MSVLFAGIPSEVLSGKPFPEFAQLPFDLIDCIAYTHSHSGTAITCACETPHSINPHQRSDIIFCSRCFGL